MFINNYINICLFIFVITLSVHHMLLFINEYISALHKLLYN